MKIDRIFAALVVTTLACTSSTATTPQQDPGVQGNGTTGAATAPDANPQGVAYPTDHTGTNARTGNHAGDRIKNYKFMGYPDGDVSQGLKPISLANFFDPTGTKFKLIHIQASGSWCPHCVNEVKAVSTIKADLEQRKAVWLVSLAEGNNVGEPSTTHDLDLWLENYKPPFTHLLDPGNGNLGPFYNDAALPWNANISAKTMEILTAGVGGIEDGKGILRDIDDAITSLDDTVALK